MPHISYYIQQVRFSFFVGTNFYPALDASILEIKFFTQAYIAGTSVYEVWFCAAMPADMTRLISYLK